MLYFCGMGKPVIVFVGGGAAGFFGAANTAELLPEAEIIILEQAKQVLGKVKVSGGGRCNVTNGCFVPKELSKHYPRGQRALIGPFTRFMTGDTMEWFESRGVPLKIEPDNRVFPTSDNSQSIIDCLVNSVDKYGVSIRKQTRLVDMTQSAEGKWRLDLGKKGELLADHVVFTPGAAQPIWNLLEKLGHTIAAPVPSLFTFNIKDRRIDGLMGLSVPRAQVRIKTAKLKDEGPLLITHWGMSGPAVLKLSAWGARALAACNYQFQLEVCWLPDWKFGQVEDHFQHLRSSQPKKQILSNAQFDLPSRLWKSLGEYVGIKPEQRWAEITNKQISAWVEELVRGQYPVNGKSTFKEEFVTCGGVDLKEVDFKTMGSKILPNVHFAGEVLDIDAITGGFNFQAAWTGSWIAAQALAESAQ
ncbi:NAD(P)/FAD-dependent oxidoreductase [Pontibacter sp. G13]|uniref:NAD(P)/FAD-dependent oxidoreductase n=1 Tax=Pontibacter sp. G13 TaxID=3074898 RepID=UPI002888FF40|nr:NAD(P)/FAD-dependent oxidoreductase [Pontibacter sp. G13]WNJ19498.1 NAD(P)/FAD-dependent oxidoreductase [Pontibacter sp. G13]